MLLVSWLRVVSCLRVVLATCGSLTDRLFRLFVAHDCVVVRHLFKRLRTMKIENMRTAMVKLYGKDRGGFLYRCLMNTTGKANVLYRRYWEKAPTVKAFIGDVHADQSLRFDSSGRGQAYGLLAKLDHWEPSVDYKSERVRRFIISADAGSVQIGDLAGTSAMNIPNGYGNGCMRVFVISLGDGNVFNNSGTSTA